MNKILCDRLVLIVDDVLLNLLILEQILQVAGATVIKAKNGKEALALLEKHPVEIILTDLQMPEMDGWELAARIRQSDKWYRQLPVIATTSETDEADKQKCFDTGMNDIVYKPIDPAGIYQKIEAIIHGNSQQKSSVLKKELTVDFDLSYLREVTKGDQESLILIVNNLKENGPLLLIQATNSVHKGNWVDVAAHLHKLKGLTALFGMHNLTNTLLKAEQEAKRESPGAQQIGEDINWISEQLTYSVQQISHLTQAD